MILKRWCRALVSNWDLDDQNTDSEGINGAAVGCILQVSVSALHIGEHTQISQLCLFAMLKIPGL